MWPLQYTMPMIFVPVCALFIGILVRRDRDDRSLYDVGFAAGLLFLAVMMPVGIHVQDSNSVYLAYKLLHLLVDMTSLWSQFLLYVKILFWKTYMAPLIGVVVVYLSLGSCLVGFGVTRLLDLIIAIVSRVFDSILISYMVLRVTQLQMRQKKKVIVTSVFLVPYIARLAVTISCIGFSVDSLHAYIEVSYLEAALTLALTIAPTLFPIIRGIIDTSKETYLSIRARVHGLLLVRRVCSSIIAVEMDAAGARGGSSEIEIVTRQADSEEKIVSPELMV